LDLPFDSPLLIRDPGGRRCNPNDQKTAGLMIQFILRRLFHGILILIGVSFITFFLIN
jgi:hypothetical protein